MTVKKDDRRRHISFKNNDREDELMKYCDKQSEKYGLSTYIKILIDKDMKKHKKHDGGAK